MTAEVFSGVAGCVMIIVAVLVQPLAVVTVIEYVPAVRLLIVDVLPPFDQAYVYGPCPPFTFTVALPVLPPKQGTSTNEERIFPGAGPCATTTLSMEIQPLASVTLTMYVPAVNPFAFALFPPDGDH